MKAALAILCSLMLALTTLVVGAVPAPSAPSAKRTCCHHCSANADCCKANHSSPGPQPLSAAPVFPSQQLSPLAPATVVWTLPVLAAQPSSSFFIPSLTTTGAPLFERNCAWLI